MDAAIYAAEQEADGIAAQAQAGFPGLSLSARERGDRKDQSYSARLGELLCGRPLQPVFLVYPRLGREEDSVPLGQGQPTPGLRMEAVEQGMVVWHARALPGVSSRPPAILLGRRPVPIGPITLVVKRAGTRSAGNPHATCAVAGAGNGASAVFRSHRASPRPLLVA